MNIKKEQIAAVEEILESVKGYVAGGVMVSSEYHRLDKPMYVTHTITIGADESEKEK